MEGIYRVSAPITRLDELEKLANSGGKLEFVDPHDAAGLLKRFLRQLPEHVLRFPPFEPGSFEGIAETCICKSDSICTCDTAGKLKEMLSLAPKENFYLIAYVFLHAKHVILKVCSLHVISNNLVGLCNYLSTFGTNVGCLNLCSLVSIYLDSWEFSAKR